MLSIRLFTRRAPHRGRTSPWPAEQRAALLQGVCTAMRLGFFDEAQAMLGADPHAGSDAACLNLLGVIHELRKQWKPARKNYRRAIRADGTYAPARQNMRRMYELDTFGQSNQCIALGDERPALATLLAARHPVEPLHDSPVPRLQGS